jgi:UDP-N-acetylmuramoylalanine--D-glutamate ligase
MGRGVYALQGLLYDATGERAQEVVDIHRARSLPGRHNCQNAAAAYAAVRGLGISPEEAAQGLMTFPGLAHRMETVGQIGKVRFVNDSTATKTDAARQAMSSYSKFYWIAGGQPKTGGIDSLSDLFPRIEKAYLVGEAAPAFAETLSGKAQAVECGTIEAATARAFADAAASGQEAIVLLSPACASFDQFADFEARGEAFRAAVVALTSPATKGARA